MVEEIVVDASILVASFLEHEENHAQASDYIQKLESGEYIFHLPRLALIEALAAVNRRARRSKEIYILRAQASFNDWLTKGKITFYDLDQSRTHDAIAVALRDNLAGADAIYAALAEELGIPLRSFDGEHLRRFQGNVSR